MATLAMALNAKSGRTNSGSKVLLIMGVLIAGALRPQ